MRIAATFITSIGVIDVLIEADGTDPIGDVLEALAATNTQLQTGKTPTAIFVDGVAVATDASLADARVRDGSIIDVAREPARELARELSGELSGDHASGIGLVGRPSDFHYELHEDAVWEITATTGPGAGTRALLDAHDAIVVGSEPGNELVLPYALSPKHTRIATTRGIIAVVDLGSDGGTFINELRLPPGQPTLLQYGSKLRIAHTAFEVSRRHDAPTPLKSTFDPETLTYCFNRPPRLRPPEPDVAVTLPSAPTLPTRTPFPWMQCCVPVVMAILAAWIFHRPEVLVFAAMSPILTVTNAVSARRNQRRTTRDANERYEAELDIAAQRIETLAIEEASQLHHDAPAAPQILRFAQEHQPRLWERRLTDPDAFVVRLGTHDRPAAIELHGANDPAPVQIPWLRGVPYGLDLRGRGVVGICGNRSAAISMARTIVTRLTSQLPPTELVVAFITGDSSRGTNADRTDWAWARWLPHRFAGSQSAAVANVLAVLDERNATDSRRDRGAAMCTPAMLVVIDGAQAARDNLNVVRILRDGPPAGIYAVAIDVETSRLPQEATAIIELQPESAIAAVTIEETAPEASLLCDLVSTRWAEEFARALAPVRHGHDNDEASIPQACRLVELLPADHANALALARRWAIARPDTRAVVGIDANGSVSLDIKTDGPHALVAGTTGSGKSEFLQTFVTSLALANRPDAMNFVLIDFKGASAFAHCARLPHTVGMVTNLNQQLTERALVSLNAELQRREQVLAQLGAADIDAAWARSPEVAAQSGLARLIIVIDEFAELVHELPDFVSGLIRIARVGRSLGVHLVLATQRPSGVVTPEMRANTALRIALRVEDPQDSIEVIDNANAAAIRRTTPGRAIARLASSGQTLEFQTGRVANTACGAEPDRVPVLVHTVDHEGNPLASGASGATPFGPATDPIASLAVRTDLELLVATMRQAAQHIDCQPRHRPWLEPLATFIVSDPKAPSIGIIDHASEQVQRSVQFHAEHCEHWMIAGASRTGRSSALRTIAATVAQCHDANDCHLYGFDFGNGALKALSSFAHCGAIVDGTRDEPERVDRLVTRLDDELTRRLGILAAHGLSDIAEQRLANPSETRLPYILVLIDRWDALAGAFPAHAGSDVVPRLQRLARDGATAGFSLVITGDRSLLSDRIAAYMDHKWVLRLNDPNDYRMADINPKSVPEVMGPGRALEAGSDREIQFALLDADPSNAAQQRAIFTIAATRDSWTADLGPNQVGPNHLGPNQVGPIRVDALPQSIAYSSAIALGERNTVSVSTSIASTAWAHTTTKNPLTIPFAVPLAVGDDRLQCIHHDFTSDPMLLVAGPRRSGRTNTLITLATGAILQGTRVLWISAGARPIHRFAPDGVTCVEFAAREDAESILEQLRTRRYLVLLDDAGAIARSPLDEGLTTLVRDNPEVVAGLVVAGSSDELRNETRGIVALARSNHVGILLCPQSPLDGDLIGARIDRSQLGGGPGRALINVGGEAQRVQIPIVDQLPTAAPISSAATGITAAGSTRSIPSLVIAS